MKLYTFAAAATVCVFLLTGCGDGGKSGENTTPDTEIVQSESEREEAVVLTERQKEILSELGLSTDYDELSVREKSAIEAIEFMLVYLEKKYSEPFAYAGYVEGNNLEKEHLIAYPEKGSMNDEVIVYRTYENGAYTCTDNYINLLTGPVYQNAMEKYISGYFPGAVLFTEVAEVLGEEVPEEDTVLYAVTAGSTVLLDESVVNRDEIKAFAAEYSTMMRENSMGMPSVMDVWLMDAGTIEEINAYNYHDRLIQADYKGVMTISVSSSGKVTTMESGF